MTGLWLVSYLVLWCVVVILALVSMAILRQLGFLYTRLPAGRRRADYESGARDRQEVGALAGHNYQRQDCVYY